MTSFSSGTELKEWNIHVRCVVEDNLHQDVVLPVRSPRFWTNTVNAIETDILCNNCRHKCRNILRRKQILDINDEEDAKHSTFRSPKKSKCIQVHVHVSSPPLIALLLPSSSWSHSYFFVCKKPGPKLLSVSNQARMDVFVWKEILIPPGARCCADHLISA